MRKGHVMSRLAISLFALCLLLCPASLTARDRDADLETVSPEKVGWSSPKLTEAARYAEQLGFSALMLVYDGKVSFWGDVETNLPCHSIRKPFLSALYGYMWTIKRSMWTLPWRNSGSMTSRPNSPRQRNKPPLGSFCRVGRVSTTKQRARRRA